MFDRLFSPQILWMAFLVLISLVVLMSAIIFWHWKKYNPVPHDGILVSTIYIAGLVTILIAIAQSIHALSSI